MAEQGNKPALRLVIGMMVALAVLLAIPLVTNFIGRTKAAGSAQAERVTRR